MRSEWRPWHCLRYSCYWNVTILSTCSCVDDPTMSRHLMGHSNDWALPRRQPRRPSTVMSMWLMLPTMTNAYCSIDWISSTMTELMMHLNCVICRRQTMRPQQPLASPAILCAVLRDCIDLMMICMMIAARKKREKIKMFLIGTSSEMLQSDLIFDLLSPN